MAFNSIDDKPKKYPIGRILSLFGWLTVLAAVSCIILAFSGYEWVVENENMGAFLMIGALGCVLTSGVFIGLSKALEEIARVHARLDSSTGLSPLAAAARGLQQTATASAEAKPKPIRTNTTNPVKERVIHISDEEAKQTGVR